AITHVKFENATHEFSTLPFVKEDVVDIILNLKMVRLRMHSDEPVTLTLNVTGAKDVTAGDITATSDVEVVNKNQHIATLTDKAANFSLELTVGRGRGYVPVENREKERLPLGTIAIDAIYTPVKNVNFSNTNVRVGQMTNFDKLTLDITTDGTLSPVEALKQATTILVDHFQFVMQNFDSLPASTMADEVATEAKPKKTRKKKADSEKTEPSTEEEA
ncbi:MAG: DNA-directed RNA polymerase subunit alpha, partial [Candidatus Kerfeldbacteria bacterium]|nr:DNA-directed RNA polymerase subunit alpha [Candidatus Kerfeldbacteria bacterium]